MAVTLLQSLFYRRDMEFISLLQVPVRAAVCPIFVCWRRNGEEHSGGVENKANSKKDQ